MVSGEGISYGRRGLCCWIWFGNSPGAPPHKHNPFPVFGISIFWLILCFSLNPVSSGNCAFVDYHKRMKARLYGNTASLSCGHSNEFGRWNFGLLYILFITSLACILSFLTFLQGAIHPPHVWCKCQDKVRLGWRKYLHYVGHINRIAVINFKNQMILNYIEVFLLLSVCWYIYFTFLALLVIIGGVWTYLLKFWELHHHEV